LDFFESPFTDLVYYWPFATDIDKKIDEDVMVFSASKLFGIAGR